MTGSRGSGPEGGPEAAAGTRVRLHTVLAPWRRRLTYRSLLIQGVAGLTFGSALAALVQGWAHVWYLPGRASLSWGLVLAGFLAGLLLGFIRRPGFERTTRQVDRALQFDDRLATALEFCEQGGPLFTAQREDALARLAFHRPERSLRLTLQRRQLYAAGTAALIAMALALTPLPQRVLRQAAVQAQIDELQKKADAAAEQLQKQPLTAEQRQELQNATAELQKSLAGARNDFDPEAAARKVAQALAKAEDRLAGLPGPGADARSRALAALGRQAAGDVQLGALGSALANQDPKAAAEAMKQLAEQVKKMSPSSRAELAKKLQQAGQATKADPGLAAALASAGQSLGTGDVSGAADALGQAAALVDAGQTQANLNDAVAAAVEGLSQGGQSVMSAAQGQGQAAQGQGGQAAQGSGQGASPGEGQGQGQGQGQGGQGNSSGGQGTDWTGDPAQFETVFTAGQIGQGSQGQLQAGPQGTGFGGRQLPYQQVLGQYAQTAREHLGQSPVPDELKGVVEQYFSDLASQP